MSASDFHCANQWPAMDFQDSEANALLSQALSYEQLAQQSCNPDQSLLMLQNEQDSWILSGQYWNGEHFVEMSKNAEQFQLWNEAAGVNIEAENLDMRYWNNDNNTLPGPNIPHEPLAERQHIFSQIAAERALFMTPFAHTPISAFPGSPVSDHSSSSATEFSPTTTYPPWEMDRDRDEIHSSPVSDVMSDIPSHPSMATGSWNNYPVCQPEDEDDVLEMPDGSTRRNSNWLPVDPHAGFTIGQRLHPKPQPEDPSFFFNPESFHDMQGAFIAPDDAQYRYNE